MEIDLIGASKVGDIIEQSKYTKFIIYRYGASRQTAPIFESIEKQSNQKAKEEFLRWARTTDNSMPYDIVLTDDARGETDIAPESKRNAKQLKFSFQLKKDEQPAQVQGQQATDFQTMLNMALDKQATSFKNDALMQKLEAMEKQIKQLEEEDEEEEAVGSPKVDINGILSGLLTSYITKQNSQPAPALSGVGEETENKNDKLKSIINRLHKIDRNIVEDLDKLATLGETNPNLFNMMLNNLRSM